METVLECRCCAQFKPADAFPNGRRQCRTCQSLKRQERRLRHRDGQKARLIQTLLQDVQQSGQSLRQAAVVNAVYREFGSPTEFARQLADTINQCQTAGRHATAAKLLFGVVTNIFASAH